VLGLQKYLQCAFSVLVTRSIMKADSGSD